MNGYEFPDGFAGHAASGCTGIAQHLGAAIVAETDIGVSRCHHYRLTMGPNLGSQNRAKLATVCVSFQ